MYNQVEIKMEAAMNKLEIIEKVASETGVSKTDITKALNNIIETIQNTVKDGEKVAIAGLGIFEKRHRKARMGVNPATGAKISIAAKDVPAFKAAKAFKELVK